MLRGEKIFIPFDDSDDDSDQVAPAPAANPVPRGAFVSDVRERPSTTAALASPPAPPTSTPSRGFPQHRQRNAASRFKRRQESSSSSKKATSPPPPQQTSPLDPTGASTRGTWDEEERRRIDRENRDTLAAMSPAQIAEERRELLDSLSPGLLARMLQRASLDSGSAEADLAQRPSSPPERVNEERRPPISTSKTVSFAEEPEEGEVASPPSSPTSSKAEPTTIDNDSDQLTPPSSIHFPRPSTPPPLDPNSTTFLTDLHTKYSPTLPSEPDKLAWMTPSSPSTSATSTTADPLLDPSTLRFAFTGALLPPDTPTSTAIPTSQGLHHHGAAPDQPGYTIRELAHLGQSTFAAQRCLAFQTLGRVLFRLGKGEWGDPAVEAVRGEAEGEDEALGVLARGLWREIDAAGVLDLLVRESQGEGPDRGRHVSARAYATEAVWLWRRGGGRRWKAS